MALQVGLMSTLDLMEADVHRGSSENTALKLDKHICYAVIVLPREA